MLHKFTKQLPFENVICSVVAVSISVNIGHEHLARGHCMAKWRLIVDPETC